MYLLESDAVSAEAIRYAADNTTIRVFDLRYDE